MEFRKNSKGITLIALVITIIVLLILAGVSLSLISGGDGILGRAEKAVTETIIAEAKERAEMLVAEYNTDFYDTKYVKKDYDGEINEYAKTSIGEGKIAGDYFVTIEANNKVLIYKGTEANDDSKIVTGTLLENSTIVWDEVEQENGGNTSKTFASQVNEANYGEYVNLGTSYVKGNALETGIAEEDWRIFYKDEDGVYLILADYLPYEYETSAVAGSTTGLRTGLLNFGIDYLGDRYILSI